MLLFFIVICSNKNFSLILILFNVFFCNDESYALDLGYWWVLNYFSSKKFTLFQGKNLILLSNPISLYSFFLRALSMVNSLCDSAGQERFRSVTHAYYRDAHGKLFFSPFFHKFILKSILRVENLKYNFNCKCRKWLHVFSEKKNKQKI